mgnify:CR=1 FL=1
MIEDVWYVVMASRAIGRKPVGATRMGQRMVFWRDGEGRVVAMVDRCPHKGVALSPGRVVDGQIRCPYHGFAFDREGACQRMPVQGAVRPAMCVTTYKTHEAHGMVWIWWGDPARCDAPPKSFPEQEGRGPWTWAEAEIAYPVDHSRFIETNFDVYHAAIAHRSVNVGGLFGTRVANLHVEHDAESGAIEARGELVHEGKEHGVVFRTSFLPGNLQLIEIGGQVGVSAAIPVDEAHCISLFRIYGTLPAPLGYLQAASVVLLEKFVVQPQDVAIMDTMTEKQCVPGKSRWVEADLGAARYVQWRRRRLGKEARRAPPAVPQARP